MKLSPLAPLILLLLLVQLLWAPLVQADIDDELKAAREQLSRLDPEEPSLQPLRDNYQQAINALQNAQKYEAKALQTRQLIERLPDQTQRLQQQLAEPGAEPEPTDFSAIELAVLEQQLTLGKAELLELEREAMLLEQQLQQSDQRQVSLQEQLAQLRQQRQPVTPSTPSSAVKGRDSEAVQLLHNALFSERTAQIQALELELLALPGRRELADLNLRLLRRQIDSKQERLGQIEDNIQRRRRQEAEQAISALESGPASDEHPLLSEARQQNQLLSQQLREAIVASEGPRQSRATLNEQLTKLGDNYRNIQQQLELNIGYIGSDLRRLILRLTQPIDTRTTLGQINNLRLRNLEMSQQATQLQTDLAGQPIIPGTELSSSQRQQYLELMRDRQALRTRLLDARQQQINELSQLLAVQQQFNEQTRSSRELLNRHLLWVPSVATIGLDWPAAVADNLRLLLQHGHEALASAPLRWHAPLAACLGGILLLALLSWQLARYKRTRQRLWHQQIGNVRHDRISHTLALLTFAPLIALPLPALLWALSRYGVNPAYTDADALRNALQASALLLWLGHTLHIWLRVPDGLFSAHFGVPANLATLLRRRVVSIVLLAIPLLSALLLIDQIGLGELRYGIGRLLLIVLFGLLLLFWLDLWRVAPAINQLSRGDAWWKRAKVWLSMLALFQLAMIALALWGYLFTAGVLTRLLFDALALLFGVFLLYRLGRRWLLVEERKLAFSRALARRAEILAAREKNEEEPPLEENYLDLQTISDQALMLLKAAAVLLLFSLLWLVLGDMLPTLDVLDNVELWSSSISTAEGTVLEAISLQDLLFAALVLAMSLLAAYNLPGLLELLILRHLPLAPGSGYAITSLVKYLLILVGILSGFSQLGVAWEKLQWLVAALSVGLGFGLQEVVANFVSGLIILFEKPVRIGDTVTIGGLTGTVTRIQIRATTIVDWDRKEVIIPNKTFITDQLVNWSLSDAITRVVIPVGLAYGSDTELAHQLLLQSAAGNPRVLPEPAPEAYFLGFGDSTLNFELRIYVSAMADRLQVTHELNGAIDSAFKAHKIDIAFRQLDVHLHRATKK
ncbi:mechanosensitive ion channel domain-containing protein [Marinobacterium arenosum]|uniref:mechanosensitive ion channel domain-containing protein n=1 Tax=Marinobacterium arenosum TaxID=2862496 RepID=UPI001C95003D|nr:mechanosensitive ion channel domain-containing protein [Marinobacterium arenosum]MBY4678048.1 mechanosensitive ion channel [Marinobacterium arenosum]